jgi:hypothetical protein
MDEILLITGNLIILSFIIVKKNIGILSPRAILALLHINLWYFLSRTPPSDSLWLLNILSFLIIYYPFSWKSLFSLKIKMVPIQTFCLNENLFDQESRQSTSHLKKRYHFLMKIHHPERSEI